MPHGGVREIAYHYSISEQLLGGSVHASGTLTQTIVGRVGCKHKCHGWSRLNPRYKRTQGDPRKSILEILTMFPHYPSHSLEGYSGKPRCMGKAIYLTCRIALVLLDMHRHKCWNSGRQCWPFSFEDGDATRRSERPYIHLLNFGAAPL
jgi:hypothetical protein